MNTVSKHLNWRIKYQEGNKTNIHSFKTIIKNLQETIDQY